MPELPEVETICKELKEILTDKRIITVKINRKDLRPRVCDRLQYAINNIDVLKIYRRAKYIVVKISGSDGLHLVFHLGMTGSLLYNSIEHQHDHLIFNLEDGSTLTFNDPRRLGGVFITYNIEKFLSNLGPEPLNPIYTGCDLFQILKTRTTEIKNILIDGKIIAGIGNIYACESLFEAKIWPFKMANSLTLTECRILVSAIKRILEKAIECGGTTVSTFRTPLNNKGNFQSYLRVYQKKKCNECGSNISKFLQFSRNTFFCESCQSPPLKKGGQFFL